MGVLDVPRGRIDRSRGRSPSLTFAVIKTKVGEYMWHATARNGRIMCDSSESYTRPEDARRAMNTYLRYVSSGEYKVRPGVLIMVPQ